MGGRGGSGVRGGGAGGGGLSIEKHGGLSYVTQDFGDGYGRTGVLAPGEGEVGSINWMPASGGTAEVGDISVKGSHQRQGIASQLWKQAQKATKGNIRHSSNRTAAGDAFARAVGGNVPARSALRPT